MDSTMQDFPLTLTAILRYGTQWHTGRKVLSATADGHRELSFGELGTRVAQLAHGLREIGVRDGDRVATFMWNNAEHLETYFAAPCMGAVLHTLNIRLAADQVAFIANEAEDRVVVVDSSLIGLLAPVLPKLDTAHTVVVAGDADTDPLTASGKTVLRYEDLLAGRPLEYDWPDLDEKSAAAMCYTSGTTGNPKGVVYSHRSTYLHSMAVCTANSVGLVDGDRVLAVVPMFHANAWGQPYAAVMAGADLVLPDRFLQAAPLVDMIERLRPTVSAAVPTIWNDVLHFLKANPDRDISSLRTVVCGGSAVPVELMKEYQQRYGVVIRQGWGMTETSPLAAVATPPPEVTGEEHWTLRAAAGRVVPGVEARIVDDHGAVLPNDGKAVGEIEIRGPWITGSYYRNADPDKFHDGWLRTGDVGRIDPQGFITLTDRAKDVIKSGGEWISSVELELAIMAHPAVFEAAVVAVPDERWQERPLAAVVLEDGATVIPQELRKHLSDKVARFWLPERWTFVEAVPRTSVGKFDKKVIRARYAEGAYDVIECRD
ncbi:acyl-CoA synthetase [Mycolicibacterium phlei]|uniref:Long-chain-fatty-acid--CoA ligase FadD13 n=1 Tax=Mycolicibacterium phlei DSM 43239 = CCUG 21000 TaxID=1226750 RepID=A0A5N5UTS7_MYCPH|nr:fatty acid--CoA ligase [Mycolicibacterium phlei]VEG09397.1 acyl-CoA synthetase [Mycobacteroides chelonae]AMO61283.1 Long-chain-fatty-acid--CoA ligase [Mycolicibacterium phlei]KAB7752477.1 long-chain fatty acid--CoA ligase [Mycolicibacterium phlei DSM 43239 = CCUG 21000]KXW60715.1 long-chain fatty acid--CoA ligase [Mycolicibacterium phlei DSM 43070]KXW60825.1 long-chain fatty acid--CoA ligase [Mycolicibacterium phlei DSM 43239 = CCUG 21000]